jgi:cholecystokinin A receptor
MEKSENISSSWINASEMYKLDRTESIDFISIASLTFENLSSSFNFSFNTSINSNHTQQSQSLIQIASRIIPLYSVIFLLAVIGNSLVILTLVQNKRMRTITNLFLLNLAVSDLFLGVFCMPFTLVGMLLRDFIFGELMCKLLPYLQGLLNINKTKNE